MERYLCCAPRSWLRSRSAVPIHCFRLLINSERAGSGLRRPSAFLAVFVAVTAAWSPASFAQQVIPAAPPTAINATGQASGVQITGLGTLIVGAGQNINTNNSLAGNAINPLAAAVANLSASQGTIVFNGSSNVFGASGVSSTNLLLDIQATGIAGTTVNFQGPVFSTTLEAATGTVNFNSGSSNSTAANFTGNGTIGLAPNTTVIGALTTNTANTGTLSLGSNSIWNGAIGGANGLSAVTVTGGNNIAGVSATITGAANAYNFNLGTNTLNIGSALTIPTGGAISTTLASASLFGNIRPTGATNLPTSLALNVTVPSTAFFPVGTTFNIVQTATGTGQSGTNGSILNITVINPTNPLYTFSQVPATGGTQAGLVEITTTGIPLLVPFAPPPGVPLPPTLPVAALIASSLLSATQTPDLVSVEAAISALTTAPQVVNALAQLGPSASDLAAPLVTFQGTREFQDLWLSRMDDVMCGEVPERQLDQNTSMCKRNEPQSGWWVKSFGYFGSQAAQGAFTGYQSRILGTMVGYDAPIPALRDASKGIETRIGVGVGYAQTTINDSGFANSTNGNTYQATAYIAHERGPWFVDGDLSFGWNNYSGARNIVFPGFDRRAQADYSGQSYTAFATTGFHFLTQGFTLTPLASLQYTHVDMGGYTESGAGAIDLKVNSQSYDFLESGLGGKVSRPVLAGNLTLVPEAHVKWLHDIVNPGLKNTSSFVVGSPAFTTPSLKTSPDTYNVGSGLTFLSCACSAINWSVEAVYNYYWRTDNYHAHEGMLRLSGSF